MNMFCVHTGLFCVVLKHLVGTIEVYRWLQEFSMSVLHSMFIEENTFSSLKLW